MPRIGLGLRLDIRHYWGITEGPDHLGKPIWLSAAQMHWEILRGRTISFRSCIFGYFWLMVQSMFVTSACFNHIWDDQNSQIFFWVKPPGWKHLYNGYQVIHYIIIFSTRPISPLMVRVSICISNYFVLLLQSLYIVYLHTWTISPEIGEVRCFLCLPL